MSMKPVCDVCEKQVETWCWKVPKRRACSSPNEPMFEVLDLCEECWGKFNKFASRSFHDGGDEELATR